MTEERDHELNHEEEPATDSGNGWVRWKNYVLNAIKRVEKKVDQVEENRHQCQLWCTQEVTKLKVKSTIWGAVAGFVASMVLTLSISIGAGFLSKNVNIIDDTEPKQEQKVDKLDDRVDELEEKQE